MMKGNEKITGIKNLEQHPQIINFMVLLIFILYASLTNWSILIGENLMKYDIWQAEYPQQVLISDAIANGTFPLWNPLMRYGTPLYAIVGTPVWYLFTLILDLIGYKPNTVAISYVMHIVLGGFGMFLLTKLELCGDKKKDYISAIAVSLIAGIFYCSSGMYLSNAQHIMIIISIAWVPYVFYFTRLYIKTKKIVYGMTAGVCAGLILTGGYPEIFYNLFLFLAFYTLYFIYKKEIPVLKNLLNFFGRYVSICCFTVLYSAIVLLPFLVNKGLITRGAGMGQIPMDFPLGIVLSALLPNMNTVFDGMEKSMINYYMGLLPILLLPLSIKTKSEHKKLYAGLGGVAFLLCGGRYSFLHSLFYRILPMYSDFRFPTLNRCFLVIFVLLITSGTIYYIINQEDCSDCIRYGKKIFCIVLAGGVIFTLLGYLFADNAVFQVEKCRALSQSCLITAGLMGAYLLIWRKGRSQKRSVFSLLLAGMVCLEGAVFFYEATPITIAMYKPNEYGYNADAKKKVNTEFKQNAKRNKSTDFSDSVRSTNVLNSQKIVFNNTFDEDGYVSFLLKSTSDFKETYLRSIIEQNPEIYFTNNVVTEADVPYDQWVNSCATPPEQIYAETPLQEKAEDLTIFKPEVIDSIPLNYSIADGEITINDLSTAKKKETSRIRLYIQNAVSDKLALTVLFTDVDGTESQYTGEFEIAVAEDGENYVDIYFPRVDKVYQSLKIAMPDVQVTSAVFMTVERMVSGGPVNVKRFGFNDIEMEVQAPSEGYVTILQAKHKGWKAYVDGEEVAISLINGNFMGLHLEEGAHTVELKFRPAEFFIGAFISGMFCIVFLAVLGYALIKNKKMKRMPLKSE